MAEPAPPTQRLHGKVAIITGSSSGIGREIAALYAQNGARVVGIDLAPPREAAAAIDGLEFVQGDVTKPETFLQAIEAGRKAFGKTPNVLVNAAGVPSGGKSLHEFDDAEWEKVFAVNYWAPLRGMRELIKALLADKAPGAIVNISSMLGHRPLAETGPYCVSKAALSHLTKVTAQEYGKHNIRVNALAPGIIETPMTRDDHTHNALDKFVAHTAVKRWGLPQEVGQGAVFLASDDASYITGQILFVDGGIN